MLGTHQRLAGRSAMGQEAREQPAVHGLEAVYLAHRPALLRFLRARGAGDAAEDLVQELWVRVARASPGPIADPLGYLYRAANNLMISRHRSAERTVRRDESWNEAISEGAADTGEMAIAARQEIAHAEQRLRALGGRVLRVFVMFRVDGLPQREIAGALGVSLSSVEKDLQRAYRALADLRSEIDAV